MQHNKELERIGLPSDVMAERMLLAAMISKAVGRPIDPEVMLAMVRTELAIEDFSMEKHRQIYRAICTLADRGESIEYFTVITELKTSGELEAVGGATYLVEIDSQPPAVDVERFIQAVKSTSLLRKMVFSFDTVISECLTSNNSEEVLGKAEQLVARCLEASRPMVNLKSPSQVKLSAPGGINGYFYPKPGETGTPWASLNEIVTFQKGQLICIGSRPGAGKSAAAGQIAHFNAQCGKGTTLFSFEMSDESILRRITCGHASVNTHKFQKGYQSREEQAAFLKASNEIDELPLWIDDTTGATVAAMQAAIRRQRITMPVELVIVDYIQLIKTINRYDTRAAAVGEISRDLKLMARDMDLTVVALSQLNRASLDSGRPGLHHLRESGSIEQDSDIVILIHPLIPEAERNGGIRQPTIETEFLVEKQREGPTGMVTLTFQRGYTRFDEAVSLKGEFHD